MLAFDYENPWHRHVNLFFCIACDSCAAEIALGELQGADREREFEEECVCLSELAMSLGWTELSDGWSFLCPSCSKVPDGA